MRRRYATSFRPHHSSHGWSGPTTHSRTMIETDASPYRLINRGAQVRYAGRQRRPGCPETTAIRSAATRSRPVHPSSRPIAGAIALLVVCDRLPERRRGPDGTSFGDVSRLAHPAAHGRPVGDHRPGAGRSAATGGWSGAVEVRWRRAARPTRSSGSASGTSRSKRASGRYRSAATTRRTIAAPNRR